MTDPRARCAASGLVAIVGHGRFGAALAALLTSAGYAVRTEAGPIAELVRGAGFVVVAVPVPAMREVFEGLAPVLQPEQIVLDVGSVKLAPTRDMEAVFGASHPWVATHPLFGPASLARGERPLRVVVCPSAAHPEAEVQVSALFRRAGCEVVSASADEHDQVMASTHALAFFVAKGLLEAGAPVSPPYAPPSYQAIVRTIETVRSDAGHLFSALHRENPHARAARRRLLEALEAADRSLAAEPALEDAGLAIPPDLGARSPALREARELIDDIDQEIVALLGQRVELARRAARAKAALGEGVRDPVREHRLRASRRGWAADRALDPDAVDEVFQAIIRYCREVQSDPRAQNDQATISREDAPAPGWSPSRAGTVIVTLEHDAPAEAADVVVRLAEHYPGVSARKHEFRGASTTVVEVHLIGSTQTVPTEPFEGVRGVRKVIRVSARYRLIGRHQAGNETLGFEHNGVRFDDARVHLFAGLCAVDTPEHVGGMMAALAAAGITTTRMGAYKPRTSPYDFQGLGAACLPWVFELAGKHGIRIVAMEVTDARQIDEIDRALEAAGRPTGVMLQIGTRNTQNFELLKHVGQQKQHPVLFKRGMGISLEESLNACEYVASEGNPNIVFCLRGVKTHLGDPHRNLVDFAHVPVIRRLTRLPVCIDPSHSVGRMDLAPDGLPDVFHVIGQGVIAGASMVLVDFHPRPDKALCDGPQALPLAMLGPMTRYIAAARATFEQAVALGAEIQRDGALAW